MNGLPKATIELSEIQKQNRINFAKKYNDIDWKKVIFSDESTVQLQNNVVRVYQKKSLSRKFPKRKFPIKIMFWGAISYEKKLKLEFVDGTMNTAGYMATLDSLLILFLRYRKKKNSYFNKIMPLVMFQKMPEHTLIGKISRF